MLTSALLFLMVVGAEVPAPESSHFTIEIAPTRSTVVLDKAHLRRICRAGHFIEACTELLGGSLRCECRRAGEHWMIFAAAQFVPYMYLSAPSLTAHEDRHLEDIRGELEAYLHHLAARQFATLRACARVARFEETVFTFRLDFLADLSQERLR